MELGAVLLTYKNQPKKTQLIFCSHVKVTEPKVHRRNGPKNLCNRSIDSISNLYMLLFCIFQNEKETLYGDGGGDDLIVFSRKREVVGTKTPTWKRRVSIPVPLACKASALPFELHPQRRGMLIYNGINIVTNGNNYLTNLTKIS